MTDGSSLNASSPAGQGLSGSASPLPYQTPGQAEAVNKSDGKGAGPDERFRIVGAGLLTLTIQVDGVDLKISEASPIGKASEHVQEVSSNVYDMVREPDYLLFPLPSPTASPASSRSSNLTSPSTSPSASPLASPLASPSTSSSTLKTPLSQRRRAEGSFLVADTAGAGLDVKSYFDSKSLGGASAVAGSAERYTGSRMPTDAFEIFSGWKVEIEQNPNASPYHAKGVKLGIREDVSEGMFPKAPKGMFLEVAFNEFKATFEKYKCNFHEIKKAYQANDPEVPKWKMQMLCDFRAAVYETKLFPAVMAKFPGPPPLLDPSTNSAGSVEVTSDWDPPFKVGSDHQTVETQAVRFFNQEFKKMFGEVAGLVFDTNAYSFQYRRQAFTQEWQRKQDEVQDKASSVMSAMTMPEGMFDAINEKIAEQISNPVTRRAFEAKCIAVQKEANNLKGRLHKEMLKEAVTIGYQLPPEVQAEYNAHLQTDDNKWALGAKVLAFFESIKNTEALNKNITDRKEKVDHYEHIKRQAKNILHESIKTSYRAAEVQRTDLILAIEDLDEINDADAFARKFNWQLDLQIEVLEKSNSQEARKFIDNLRGSKISPMENKVVMNAFHDMRTLTKQRGELIKSRARVEAVAQELAHVNRAIEQLEKQQQSGLFSDGKLSQIKVTLKKKRQERDELLATEFNRGEQRPPLRGGSVENLEKLKKELDGKIGVCAGKIAAAKQEKGAAWHRAELLLREADRLMVGMEAVHTRGMIFADEAHVSGHAFSRTVGGFQMGDIDCYPLSNEMNAVKEIGSFGFDHMHSHSDSKMGYSMVANGAKYMDRISRMMDIMEERCIALGVSPLVFPPEPKPGEPPLEKGELSASRVESLRKFMTGLAPYRSQTPKNLEEIVRGLAVRSGLMERGDSFTAKVAEEMFKDLQKLYVKMRAFGEQIPDDRANATFKTVDGTYI